MRGRAWFMLALLIAPLAVSAQRSEGPRPAQPARRAELEAEIFERFMDRVTQELQLDAAGRQRLAAQLRDNGERRRALARSTVQLRQELVRAAKDSTRSDAEIQRLLGQLEQLRARENDLWTAEQEGLSRVLTPRQRAIFTLEWLRFNERVRGLMMERRPPQRRQ